MKNQNRVRFNEVSESVDMLNNMPPEKKKVALLLIDFLMSEATGKAVRPNLIWDCLPSILSFGRNDKFRLARAFRKIAEDFHSAQRVALAKRFEYWAERIHMITLYDKHPEAMRPLIKSCMPAVSQNN
jgi:hypothetical protein